MLVLLIIAIKGGKIYRKGAEKIIYMLYLMPNKIFTESAELFVYEMRRKPCVSTWV